MMWLEKQVVLSKKSERGRKKLKSITKNPEFKKLKEYNELVLQLYKIDNDSVLEEIDNILALETFTKCRMFPLVISDIINMNNTDRLQNFKRLINICSRVSDIKFKVYIYLKFISLNNRDKEDELNILVEQLNLEDYDYEKIVNSIFRSNDINWIYEIRVALDDYGYNEKVFDKLIMIENPKCLKYLSGFISGRGNEKLEAYIDDLVKITDYGVLDLICEVILDEDLLESQHYSYIVNKLLNVKKEKLTRLVDIAIEPNMINLENYKEIIDAIFLIEDVNKLSYIQELVSDCDSCYLGEIVNIAIKIDEIGFLKEFIRTITRFDDEYLLNLLNLDFTNEKTKLVIKRLKEIFSIMESGVILSRGALLNLVFNKILVVKNYDNILSLLDEILIKVNCYSTKSLCKNNSLELTTFIDEKINDIKDKQLVKNMKCEKEDA